MTFLDVFRVLVSPIKAFKEIVERPDRKGPIIILVITLLATACSQYIWVSKILIETPVLDATLIPNLGPPYNITSGFTNPDSPSKISVFTYNWTSGSDNVTIYGNDATGGYIEEKLTAANVSTYSYNATISVNFTTYFTTKEFGNVTKVEFSKAGDNSSQYVMLGTRPAEEYSSSLAQGVLGRLLISSLLNTVIFFFLRWTIYTVLLWVIIKVFREGTDSFSGLFSVIGYAFVAIIIFSFITTLLISTFPTVKLPIEAWGPPQEAREEARTVALNLIGREITNPVYQEAWFSNLAYQLGFFLEYYPVVDIWIVTLAAIAIHFLCEITWKKAMAISATVYAIRFILWFFVRI